VPDLPRSIGVGPLASLPLESGRPLSSARPATNQGGQHHSNIGAPSGAAVPRPLPLTNRGGGANRSCRSHSSIWHEKKGPCKKQRGICTMRLGEKYHSACLSPGSMVSLER
jgi:hypothetical protein